MKFPAIISASIALPAAVLCTLPALAQSEPDSTPPAEVVQEEAPATDSPVVLEGLPEGANVVIFRRNAQPTVWAATVKIEGDKVAALVNKQWTAATLEPGTYRVSIAWPFISGQSGGRYNLTVVEGETHYLEITGQSQFAGFSGTGMTFNMGSGIGEITGEGAAGHVADCCNFKEPTS